MAFTGTLLLATFWHAEEFSWFSIVAHLWIILYVVEPVTMIYLVPRGAEAQYRPSALGGPIQRGLKWLLIAEVAILGTLGTLLIINPKFADLRYGSAGYRTR